MIGILLAWFLVLQLLLIICLYKTIIKVQFDLFNSFGLMYLCNLSNHLNHTISVLVFNTEITIESYCHCCEFVI